LEKFQGRDKMKKLLVVLFLCLSVVVIAYPRHWRIETLSGTFLVKKYRIVQGVIYFVYDGKRYAVSPPFYIEEASQDEIQNFYGSTSEEEKNER
jgi:hypothetical protein